MTSQSNAKPKSTGKIHIKPARIVAIKESNVSSLTPSNPPPHHYHSGEFDGEGDASSRLFNEFTETESVNKLCGAIVDNFLATAWSICAERYYHGNAPQFIANELRNTWLRIIESEWLDQDQALETNFTPDMIRPDEPPPPLETSSRSTEMFMNSRPVPEATDIAVGGSGEPAATAQMEKVSPKKSTRSKEKQQQSARSKKSQKSSRKVAATPITKKGAPPPKGKPPKKRGKSKPGLTPKKMKKNAAEIKPPEVPLQVMEDMPMPAPNVSVAESENEAEEDDEQEGCVPLPPPPKPELPLDLIYMTKRKVYEDDALSPSISQEYRVLGLEPWDPTQCGGEDSFRDANTSSSSTMQATAKPIIISEVASAHPHLDVPTVVVKKSSAENNPQKLDPASNNRNPSSQDTAMTKDTEDASGSPVNILDRLNNLLVADSDFVVDILKPNETEQIVSSADNSPMHSKGGHPGSIAPPNKKSKDPPRNSGKEAKSMIPKYIRPSAQAQKSTITPPTGHTATSAKSPTNKKRFSANSSKKANPQPQKPKK